MLLKFNTVYINMDNVVEIIDRGTKITLYGQPAGVRTDHWGEEIDNSIIDELEDENAEAFRWWLKNASIDVLDDYQTYGKS